MAISHTAKVTYTQGGIELSQEVTVSSSSEVSVDESIPDSSTDLQITVSIDVSALKSLYISSDQNITIETNSATVPDNTLTLVANEPVLWTENSVHANPIVAADVTAIYVTNSSGSAASLKLRALVDSTP